MSDFGALGSFKELENVVIKTLAPIEVNGVEFEAGETIAAFDRIDLANFSEVSTQVRATGGYANRTWVTWDTNKETDIEFTQGVFSLVQFALLNNTRIIESNENQYCTVNCREKAELDEDGKVILNHTPVNDPFVYDIETGEKLSYTMDDMILDVAANAFTEVLVEYRYDEALESYALIGDRLFKGFLSLEGRTRMKDETDGRLHTVVVHIPKMQISSPLRMRLGVDAPPVVGRFSAKAIPVGVNGAMHTVEFYFLENNLPSDED